MNFLDAKTIKIGLGSCLDQDYPQPIWDSIEKEGLDYFIFLGDNVYGDSPNGSLRKMEQAYQKQNLMLPTFLDDITIFSIWDDHDYGVNDGGNEYKYKKESEAMFLDFWDIDKKDVRYSREGLYFAKNIELHEKTFKLIFLDTRYFRSKLSFTRGQNFKKKYIKNTDPESTILGTDQWKWLSLELNDNFDFLIIFSSIQILPEDHDYEKWGNFPNDRNKLLHKLKRHNKKTILISGDRHRSGIYKKDNIYEITASSLNKPGSSFFETDKYLLNETYPQANFGLLKIHKKTIDIEIKDKYGKILNSVSIDY
ncbi:MAG: phosphatase [Gammaproteobacteria bacterium]|nr:phosphatase [Gammaproteobacteria bacterium]